MDIKSLIATGLTQQQAATYALLIELGEAKPPEVAKHLKTTRTNAYKLLDKLVELGLVSKIEASKKIAYRVDNPIALASLGARYREEAVTRENAINNIMHELLTTYHKHSDSPGVTQATGRQDVAATYRKQLNLREDIYFIHTPADVSMMGFDTMHEIRVTPSRHGNRRHGILTAEHDQKINYESHKRSNLEITWTNRDSYTAPVEWSVTKSSLLIIMHAAEPQAIFIVDPVIAGAFLQLWKLLSSLLAQQPFHQAIEKKDPNKIQNSI